MVLALEDGTGSVHMIPEDRKRRPTLFDSRMFELVRRHRDIKSNYVEAAAKTRCMFRDAMTRAGRIGETRCPMVPCSLSGVR